MSGNRAALIPGRVRDGAEDMLKVARYLVRHCGLGEDDLRRIITMQEAEELRFSEAAVRLGVATQADVDAALTLLDPEVSGVRAAAGRELTIAHDPFSPRSERLRALRTELLLRLEPGAVNVFAIVSSASGEGRSRLAAELAVGFAQLDQPTLLVDADLRAPRQQSLFGAGGNGVDGLAQSLRDGRALQVTPVAGLPQLALLPAGKPPDNPLELLAGGFFAELLGGWSRRYRHIVIDTPPLSACSDALAIAAQSGSVLALAREQHTPLHDWQTLLQRVRAARARILGAVLNRF